MLLEAYGISDVGLKRQQNEDRCFIDLNKKIVAVSDGMGGHAAGEVAAERSLEIASDYLVKHWSTIKDAHKTPNGYFRVLQLAEDAIEEASRQIYEQASNNSDLAGMGATLTLLVTVDDKGIMAHVGDSRLYLQREGQLHLLSNDHTLAQELFQMGKMTREQAKKSHYAHVLTRSIGTQKAVRVESLLFDLLPGDICLTCSDGLSNYFDDDQEISRMLAGEDFDEIPQQLVEFAKSHGGSDNITAIVSRVSVDSDITPPSVDQLKQSLSAMKSVFLFDGLSLSRLTRVMNIASIDNYSPGQPVISVDDDCQGLYIVLGGRFSLTCDTGNSKELTTGKWFGADSLLHKQKSRASIVAKEASRLMYISGPDFERLTQRQPKLGRRLLRRLSQHLSEELYRRQVDGFDPYDTVDG